MSEIIMPKMGDAMTEGKLIRWRVADGAAVKAGDILADIETDKSNVEVDAEDSGVVHLHIQPGAVVPVGEVIATIGDVPAKKAVRPATPEPARVSEAVPAGNGAISSRSAPARAEAGGRERVNASPLARRVARELGIDIALVTGTGPNGRIIEADVTSFSKPRPAAVPTLPAMPAAQPAADVSPVELSTMRRIISRRMVESKTTIPHFYLTVDIDMNEAIELRDKLNGYDEALPKISLNDMLVKAAAWALVQVPAVNAAVRDDKIYPGTGVHIGIAVALDEGLIVPVVRDVDKITLRTLARTSRDLIKRARDKKLQPDEYSGGTFTVSNMGSFGVEHFTAIIDPTQGGILAVASIVAKPVVLEDGVTIAVRQRMNATFSGDHRLIDGATGGRFLQEFKRALQHPVSLLE
ncbi:MAG: dihydrolipoamide acetyltransferase family protein [Capsulimonadaceae bacterium]